MADEAQDQSHLDLKDFIDPHVYNCPYCNRRHVSYELRSTYTFDWTATKRCACYFVKCRSCDHTSMHLSFAELREKDPRPGYGYLSRFQADVDIDSRISRRAIWEGGTTRFADRSVVRFCKDCRPDRLAPLRAFLGHLGYPMGCPYGQEPKNIDFSVLSGLSSRPVSRHAWAAASPGTEDALTGRRPW